MSSTWRALGAHSTRLLAAVILLCGVALSLIGSAAWTGSVRSNERQAFHTTATAVGETAQTLLRRDTDFVGTLDSVLTVQPHLSQQAFETWYATLEGRSRQVGGLGTGVVSIVPAAQLHSFLVRRDASPGFRALVGGRILPVAANPGGRYCLMDSSAAVLGTLGAELGRVLQGNWCDPHSLVGGAQLPLERLATDTHRLLSFPAYAQHSTSVVFEIAYYRPGVPLISAAQRRAAVSGWIVSSFDIGKLLRLALGSHTGLAVSLRHANPGAAPALLGARGRAAAGGEQYSSTFTAGAEEPFSVTVRGAAEADSLSAAAQGLLVLAMGLVATVLMAALVLVLGRSRARALEMVREKTAELRHQALHDPLTDLPNRTLALDRATQMLARAARAGASVSALYIDVDGFKAVNDTLGHAAGDELLRVIAARLSSSVRAGDTAARLSGDEFLVLAHDPGGEAGPPLARRLLAKLSEPYETVQGTEGALRVSVSIGVACGLPESPEELVRDADLALYAAKQAGRARYAVFRPAMTVEAQRRVAQSAARRASVQRRGVGAAEAAVDQEGRGGHEAGLRAG